MTQTEVYEIQQRYLKDRLDIGVVLEQLHEAIGGIRAVIYKPGKKLKFQGGDDKLYSWMCKGLRNKDLVRTEVLAAHAYVHAQQSGSRTPGEVHLGRGMSSKHYAGGLRELVLGM